MIILIHHKTAEITSGKTTLSCLRLDLRQRLLFQIIQNIICGVSILDLVSLGPAFSTEAHQRAASQQNTQGNYDCGADDLPKHTCAGFRTILYLNSANIWGCYLCFSVKERRVLHVWTFFRKHEEQSSRYSWEPVAKDIYDNSKRL